MVNRLHFSLDMFLAGGGGEPEHMGTLRLPEPYDNRDIVIGNQVFAPTYVASGPNATVHLVPAKEAAAVW